MLHRIHLFLLHCRTQRKELVLPESSVCQKGFNTGKLMRYISTALTSSRYKEPAIKL